MQLDEADARLFLHARRAAGHAHGRRGPDRRRAGQRGRRRPSWRASSAIYGEERQARRIAAAIVRRRAEQPFARTLDLAEVVERALGGRRGAKMHPATRVFQALRIAVNAELDELEPGLVAAERVLKAGGRLAVVTFHSLEDRIVKAFLTERAGRDARRLAPCAAARQGTARQASSCCSTAPTALAKRRPPPIPAPARPSCGPPCAPPRRPGGPPHEALGGSSASASAASASSTSAALVICLALALTVYRVQDLGRRAARGHRRRRDADRRRVPGRAACCRPRSPIWSSPMRLERAGARLRSARRRSRAKQEVDARRRCRRWPRRAEASR